MTDKKISWEEFQSPRPRIQMDCRVCGMLFNETELLAGICYGCAENSEPEEVEE